MAGDFEGDTLFRHETDVTKESRAILYILWKGTEKQKNKGENPYDS